MDVRNTMFSVLNFITIFLHITHFTVKKLQPVNIIHSRTLINLSLKFGQYSLGDCEVYFKGEKLSWGESFAIFANFGTKLQS